MCLGPEASAVMKGRLISVYKYVKKVNMIVILAIFCIYLPVQWKTVRSLPFQQLHGYAELPCDRYQDPCQSVKQSLVNIGLSLPKICNAHLLLELIYHPAHKEDIKIFTTKVGIAVCALDFKYTRLDFQDGDIKSATTQVEDSYSLVAYTILV